MSRKTTIFSGAVIAIALVLAATGAAFAQAAGGRGGSTGGNTETDPSKVLTYGLPGNCPPTMAGCNEVQKPKPVIIKKKTDGCGEFAVGSAAYAKCRRGY